MIVKLKTQIFAWLANAWKTTRPWGFTSLASRTFSQRPLAALHVGLVSDITKCNLLMAKACGNFDGSACGRTSDEISPAREHQNALVGVSADSSKCFVTWYSIDLWQFCGLQNGLEYECRISITDQGISPSGGDTKLCGQTFWGSCRHQHTERVILAAISKSSFGDVQNHGFKVFCFDAFSCFDWCVAHVGLLNQQSGPSKDSQSKYETARLYKQHLDAVSKDRQLEEFLQADWNRLSILALLVF